MDFALTEEQGFIRDTVRKFVAKECEREAIKKMDEEGIFPADLFRKVADIGLCALTVPEAYGGGGPNTWRGGPRPYGQRKTKPRQHKRDRGVSLRQETIR